MLKKNIHQKIIIIPCRKIKFPKNIFWKKFEKSKILGNFSKMSKKVKNFQRENVDFSKEISKFPLKNQNSPLKIFDFFGHCWKFWENFRFFERFSKVFFGNYSWFTRMRLKRFRNDTDSLKIRNPVHKSRYK